MRLIALVLALGGLALPAWSAPSADTFNRLGRRSSSSTPLLPSQDPFYDAPADLESTAPGAILRIRTAPSNITSVVANCSAAYNILYRTTDSRYNASYAVTTLLVPKQPSKFSDGQTANQSQSVLLSYQIPYNAADADASPSYGLSTIYAVSENGIASATGDISAALSAGWFVNIPDFEGPHAAFGSGPQEGHAVLDSVRASLESGLFQGSRAQDVRYALWGYSGGSLASLWAVELQAQYAPELNFAGAAVGGMVPSLTHVMANVSSSAFAGLIPEALLGITAEFPDTRQSLVNSLKTEGPYNATGFLAALNMSISEAFVTYANQDIFQYFEQGAAFLTSPEMMALIGNTVMLGYHGLPQMPMFAYKAIGDELSPVGDSDALISHYCSAGSSNILYQRNTVGGHVAEIVNGDQRALAWLASIFDGTNSQKYNVTGCVVQNVTVNITSSPV